MSTAGDGTAGVSTAGDGTAGVSTAGDGTAGDRVPWRFSHHAEVLVMSFAALLVETSYTRIISYKLYYYYVFLILGLALLGIGTGGVVVALSKRLRVARVDAVLFWSFVLGSVSTIVAYVVVAWVPLNTLDVWRYGTAASYRSFEEILLLCLCIFVPFVAPGVMIATLFGRRPAGAGGIYFVDLVGAGAACALVIFLVDTLGAPATVMVAAAAMGAGALWVGLRRKPVYGVLGLLTVVAALAFTVQPTFLPRMQVDGSKTIGPTTQIAYHSWGPVFRVDVSLAIPVGGSIVGGLFPGVRELYHDGILGSGIYHWNGKRASVAAYHFATQPLGMPFYVLGSPPTNEAVIGAAGGHEVLASIGFGAKHIDAVELNPVTVNLVRNVYADFDGHLAQYPGVDYIAGDGWSFMARHQGRFGLVWYPAPDSYAAGNAGLASANVTSESYLYTTNAITSMLQHTTNDGMFVAQFGEVNDTYDLRTARLVATARQSLAGMGVPDPKDHVMVAMTQSDLYGPLATIFVKRQPFTPAQIAGFNTGVKSIPQTRVLYAPGDAARPNPVQSVVTTPNARLGAFYASFPYDITPTTDNDPYFYHFARFGTVIDNFFRPLNSLDREDAVAERVLLLLLVVSVVLAAIFLLLPFVVVRRAWRRMPRKGSSALVFTMIGLGFMFFEITLLQELNLFLGYPSYALTVTLMALLVFSGVGALFSQWVRDARRAVPKLLVVIAALTLFYLVGLTPLTDSLLTIPFAGRVAVTLLVLAPLGLALGMFMPLGVREVGLLGDHPREYVAWGWAVNGFAAVVGSALATILSMSFGFDFVLSLAFGAYALASVSWLLLTRRGATARRKGGRLVVGQAERGPLVPAGRRSLDS